MEQTKGHLTFRRFVAWLTVIFMAMLLILFGFLTLASVLGGITGAIKDNWKWLIVFIPTATITGLLAWASYKGMRDAYAIARSVISHPVSATSGSFTKIGPAVFFLAIIISCGWYAVSKFAELQTKASEGATVGKLAMMRVSIQVYYGKTGGKFPADLQELLPQYLPAHVRDIPFAHTANHGKNSAVQYISGDDYRAGKFTDTGGWAYVNTPGDNNWGTLVVNCTHKLYKREQLWTKI